jgi:hypothetical protein
VTAAYLTATYQSRFHARWRELQDPHVRALAWLLESPDLLNPQAPQWHGQIASLSEQVPEEIRSWLLSLDKAPSALHARLHLTPFTRLGRYAEALMAFYFERLGILAAYGVPVREGKERTVGEFDFLLRMPEGLVHWEFATKLYLLEASGKGQHVDYFVGPNLVDTLGAKIGKILHQQLKLAEHPSAQAILPQPLAGAQALVKGWLFYRDGDDDHDGRDDELQRAAALGVSANHCRGFWITHGEMDDMGDGAYAILPRLQWLAPANMAVADTLDLNELQASLAEHFQHDSMPVLIAALTVEGDTAVEMKRGFIVPDDWQLRAGLRARSRSSQY